MQPVRRMHRKLVVAFVVGLLALLVYLSIRNYLTSEQVIAQESGLRGLFDESPFLITVAATCIYILVAALSLPGCAVLSLVYGWLFGFWIALIVVSVGSTAGATIAMLLSRFLLRDWVQSRFARQFERVSTSFERDGLNYLLILRLVPAVPFFLVNLLMGLTKIRVTTFWWISQIGMLPGTMVFVYAGASFPSLEALSQQGASGVFSWQLVTAFALLGLLPYVIRKLISKLMPQVVAEVPHGESDA